MKTSGNTIFIPGATAGIGLGLALRLQQAGNQVIVGGRRRQLLEQIVAEHPGIDGVLIDTADPDSVIAAAQQVITNHPETNVLITMAGTMRSEDFRTQEFLATAEQTVTTNLLGPLRLIAAFVDHLAEQPDAVIMTVSSGLASVPKTATPTYNATKAAIHMLSEGIRLQLAETSIQVHELVPPAVRTRLIDQFGTAEIEQAMPLEDYLDEVMSLIANQPDATEILVDRVKFLRYAELRGEYDQVVAMINQG